MCQRIHTEHPLLHQPLCRALSRRCFINLSAAPRACLIFLISKVREQVTGRIPAGAEGHAWRLCPLPLILPPPAGHNGPPGGQDGGDAQDPVSRRWPRAAGPGGRCARQPCPAEQPSAGHAGIRCLWEPLGECVSCAGSQQWMLRMATGATGCHSPLKPCGTELFSRSPGNSRSNVALVSLWRRASEPAVEGQMACRRGTRRF